MFSDFNVSWSQYESVRETIEYETRNKVAIEIDLSTIYYINHGATPEFIEGMKKARLSALGIDKVEKHDYPTLL